MLLAVDIGNTNMNLGVFNGLRLVKRYAFATKGTNYSSLIEKIIQRYKIKNAVVCGVVPRATKKIENALKQLLDNNVYIIGKDIAVPMLSLIHI